MKKAQRNKGLLRLVLALALLVVFVFSLVRLIRYAVSSFSDKKTNQQLQEMYREAEDAANTQEPASNADEVSKTELSDQYQYIGNSVLPELKGFLMENHDTVAWLRISGDIVDLPVVYRNNTYYLEHNFYREKSEGGTLFLDEMHPFLEDTQYLVIHGHSMQDGSMFGLLTHYRNEGYIEAHPTLTLSTLYRKEEYEVIGVLCVPEDVNSDGFVPYLGMRKFRSAEQFYDFAKIIRKNALHWKEGAEMHANDALLALSTCYEDERIVVMCRRTSP